MQTMTLLVIVCDCILHERQDKITNVCCLRSLQSRCRSSFPKALKAQFDNETQLSGKQMWERRCNVRICLPFRCQSFANKLLINVSSFARRFSKRLRVEFFFLLRKKWLWVYPINFSCLSFRIFHSVLVFIPKALSAKESLKMLYLRVKDSRH